MGLRTDFLSALPNRLLDVAGLPFGNAEPKRRGLMVAKRLEELLRSCCPLASRRGLLARVTSGLLAAPAIVRFEDVAGKKKRRNKKKKRNRKKRKPQPSPLPRLVYECRGPGLHDDPQDATTRTAQTFLPGSSGPLRQITFPIDKEPGSLGDYIVQLLAVDPATEVPSHLAQGVLAEAIIPNSAVPAGIGVPLTAAFNGPLLQQGALYAAAISRRGPDDYQNHFWPSPSGGNACSGSYFASFNGGPFSQAPNLDTVVSVFIT